MTRADAVAIALTLILLPYLYITFWGSSGQGEMVQIRVAEGEALSLPLDYNKRIEIEGVLGTSVIEIKDRQVRFIDSPCKEKQCVISGWLSKDGDTTACMPNGVSIQVVGRDNRFDAVNF